MSADRYQPRVEDSPTDATITRDMLSARIQLAGLVLLHTPGIDLATKIGTFRGIALVAIGRADHWGLEGNARRTFFRLCGLRGDGALTEEMIERLGECDAES